MARPFRAPPPRGRAPLLGSISVAVRLDGLDEISQLGRPLEVEALGGRYHLALQLEDALLTRVVTPALTDRLAGAFVPHLGLDPDRPPLSVTDAVTTCCPGLRSERVKEAPLPMGPSMLDVQVRLALRSPSSASFALAAKATELPSV